ncbi:hypothetical protein TNCV_3622241 [Trichonephila clavipes]|nr:hypothetical protein TNCV_3622241 [Trichonephila clavipes]
MFDPSSFADPTPLAHADTLRDVLPRGAYDSNRFKNQSFSQQITIPTVQLYQERYSNRRVPYHTLPLHVWTEGGVSLVLVTWRVRCTRRAPSVENTIVRRCVAAGRIREMLRVFENLRYPTTFGTEILQKRING